MLNIGDNFNIAVTVYSEVYSWGRNDYGQLGLGHNNSQNIPQLVDFFKNKQIKKIICGKSHIIAITEIGEVYSWGRNYFGQLGLNNDDDQNIPQQVEFFKDKQIKKIICGGYHTFAITENGDVYSWGSNFHGQLGLGHQRKRNQNIPQQVDFFKDKQIKKIKCGESYTIAITENGEVYSWGFNYYGQLGLGNYDDNHNIPQLVDFFKDKQIKKIICGGHHTFAITNNNDVYSWGHNNGGQLGLGHKNNQSIPQLVDFFKEIHIKKIICEIYHTFVITNMGDIYSWGYNNHGQLGLGNNKNQNVPQLVEFFKDKQIRKIKCGDVYTIAITDNGDVYSCGGNYSGELGLGHYGNQNIPQLVEFFKEHPIITRIINIKSAYTRIINIKPARGTSFYS